MTNLHDLAERVQKAETPVDGAEILREYDNRDKIIYNLWKLLDDIDTASDIFKSSYESLASYTYRIQRKRFEYADEVYINLLYNKYYQHKRNLIGEQNTQNSSHPLKDMNDLDDKLDRIDFQVETKIQSNPPGVDGTVVSQRVRLEDHAKQAIKQLLKEQDKEAIKQGSLNALVQLKSDRITYTLHTPADKQEQEIVWLEQYIKDRIKQLKENK